MPRELPRRFVVLIPVKPPSRGKSRLAGIPSDVRADLARAFALDTTEAALAAETVEQVLVVTDDAIFADQAQALGAHCIPDGVSESLNGTLRQAAAEALRRWPGLTPVALCGDLPALRPAELDAALSAVAPGESAFVADTEGTGTTLYTADHAAFDPHFGAGSRAAHEGTGARSVEGELPGLRRDVDDLDSLREAQRLAFNGRTLSVSLRLASSAPPS